ncbi:hypothetical protein L7F22_009293 [Adiantum nelumboides]|nr:hypothetical protein [Adiantum nelumboides]
MSTWNKHYHWKTKNATPWTKDYFQKNLVGANYDLTKPQKGNVKIDSISHFEGDVELGNRKGRLITIYDCQLTLDWSGKLNDGKGEEEEGTEAKGTISFPEVSHEVQDEGEEYKFRVEMTSSTTVATQSMLEAVRSHLVPSVLPFFHKFRDELIASHAKDLGHEGSNEGTPTGGSGVSTPKDGSTNQTTSNTTTATSTSTSTAPKKEDSSKLSTTKVNVESDLSIRSDDLWDLLTNPGRIPMWTRAPAQLSLNPGSTFSLFNGNVTGSIISIEPTNKLVQKWRAPQWPTNHFGTLTTTLAQGDSSTKLSLSLEGVPLEEEDRSRDALDRFYIAGLKGLGLGTGAVM